MVLLRRRATMDVKGRHFPNVFKCKMRDHTQRENIFQACSVKSTFAVRDSNLHFSIPGTPCGAIYLTDSRDPTLKTFLGDLPLSVAIFYTESHKGLYRRVFVCVFQKPRMNIQ